MKVLDHRIAQEFSASLFDFCPGLIRRLAFDLDLKVFPDMDGFDAGVTHVLERVLHCFPLGIQDRFLGRDDYFGFHSVALKMAFGRAGGEVFLNGPEQSRGAVQKKSPGHGSRGDFFPLAL
jgi:hypothetical protein